MNKYLKLTLIFICIWIVASVLNGLLSTLIIVVFDQRESSGVIALSLLFSFIFSAPFVFVIWICGMVSMSITKIYDRVYRLLLYATFAISIAGAFLFKDLFKEFKEASTPLSISVVLSAISSIMLFRKELKTINTN